MYLWWKLNFLSDVNKCYGVWAGGKCSDQSQDGIMNSFRSMWIFLLFLSGTQIILLCCLNRCKKSLHTRFIFWDLHKQDKFSFYQPLFSLLFVTTIYKVQKKCIDSSKLRNQRASESIIRKLQPFQVNDINITYRNSTKGNILKTSLYCRSFH